MEPVKPQKPSRWLQVDVCGKVLEVWLRDAGELERLKFFGWKDGQERYNFFLEKDLACCDGSAFPTQRTLMQHHCMLSPYITLILFLAKQNTVCLKFRLFHGNIYNISPTLYKAVLIRYETLVVSSQHLSQISKHPKPNDGHFPEF